MGLFNLSRVRLTLFPAAALAVSLLFSSLSFAGQPRIFIESTGAIGHTPRLIGIPAGWSYAPYKPDAALGSISSNGSISQLAKGLTSKVGSPPLPDVLVNSSIEIKSTGLKKALKSCSRKKNTLFTLATFAALMIDEGWFLDENGVLMMESDECDLIYRGNFNLPLPGNQVTPVINSSAPLSISKPARLYSSHREFNTALSSAVGELNNLADSNSRISPDSAIPCPFDFPSTFCIVLYPYHQVDTSGCPVTSMTFPMNCAIKLDLIPYVYAATDSASSVDYYVLPPFELTEGITDYPTNILRPLPSLANNLMQFVRFTSGDTTCAVVSQPVPQSEIDSAIDSNNFIVQMVDLSKMQFDNADLLLLEEDMSVLIKDVDFDALEPVTETETDNVTGDVTVTETTTDLGAIFSNNPSDFPGLNFDVGNTTNTYQNGNLTSSTSKNTSYQSPSSPPTGGGTTGGGTTGGGTGDGSGGGGIDCEFMPTACAFMDWFKDGEVGEEPDLSSIMRNNDDFSRTKSINFGSAVCPAPHTIYISSLSMSVDLSFDFFCQFAQYARALVLAAAYMFAAYISLGVARG
ncbi:MAG: TspB protein [Inoviridae sp.]|nr:MAG: TspB protein [Inoviridae sp.]